MNTKNLVLMALLVGVGATLYVVIPGFNGGMKPDFMLTMMFIGILLFPQVKNVFLLAGVTGVISGLFSTMAGALIPNILDKFITAFAFFGIILLLKKTAHSLMGGAVLVAVGTILSGTIFLSILLFIMKVGIPFALLFGTVVIPTAVLNSIVFFIVMPIIKNLLKRSTFETAFSN